MIKKLKSKSGNTMISFIITLPLLVAFMTYLVCGFTFNRANHDFYTITNSTFDRVLVEGQLTTELENEMLMKLEKAGFDKTKIEINVNKNEVFDNSDSTFVNRGEEIQVKILHKKPHYFYYINNIITRGNSNEKNFYIGSVFTGMSEKL